MTEQTTTKIINIHDRPPSAMEHIDVFLGIVVSLVVIGGFIWKIRGTKNENGKRD